MKNEYTISLKSPEEIKEGIENKERGMDTGNESFSLLTRFMDSIWER